MIGTGARVCSITFWPVEAPQSGVLQCSPGTVFHLMAGRGATKRRAPMLSMYLVSLSGWYWRHKASCCNALQVQCFTFWLIEAPQSAMLQCSPGTVFYLLTARSTSKRRPPMLSWYSCIFWAVEAQQSAVLKCSPGTVFYL